MRRALATILLCLALPACADAATRKIDPLPKSWQKGANVTAFRWDDFDKRAYRGWMQRLRRNAHADSAAFVTRWFQYWKDPLRSDDLIATDIQPAPGDPGDCGKRPRYDQTRCQTPSIASETKAIRYAQSLGFKIVIKPLVDVGRDARYGKSRDDVELNGVEERNTWFQAYKGMLSQYARMARDVKAEMLVIGTGLTKMSNDAEDWAQWRTIVADIRSGALMGDGRGGYKGQLTFAMSPTAIFADAADPSKHGFVWDDLDVIGVEGFWPLVSGKDPDHDNPAVGRLRQGWTLNFLAGGMPPGIALRALHTEYGKPVILTGLGYLSRGGTSADPTKGNDAQRNAGGTYNTTAQARPYRAAFDFWSGVARREGWFEGIYWWNWNAGLRDVRNGDYSPQGKPAETELCLRHLGRFSKSCRPSHPPG
jgi:hypothetical protein